MPRRHQPQPRINSKHPGTSSPSGEPPSSSSPPSQRPPTRTPGEQGRQPGPHHGKIKAPQIVATPRDLGQMLQQRNDIPDIGPNGMRRQATLQPQMPLEVVNRPSQHSRQPHSRAKQAGPHRLRIRHKRTHCAAPFTWSSIATHGEQADTADAHARIRPAIRPNHTHPRPHPPTAQPSRPPAHIRRQIPTSEANQQPGPPHHWTATPHRATCLQASRARTRLDAHQLSQTPDQPAPNQAHAKLDAHQLSQTPDQPAPNQAHAKLDAHQFRQAPGRQAPDQVRAWSGNRQVRHASPGGEVCRERALACRVRLQGRCQRPCGHGWLPSQAAELNSALVGQWRLDWFWICSVRCYRVAAPAGFAALRLACWFQARQKRLI
jgi:hypothetical protein